jgi:hypothetical protein
VSKVTSGQISRQKTVTVDGDPVKAKALLEAAAVGSK